MAADICNFCFSKGIDASSTGATIEFRKSLFTGEQIMEEIKQDQGAQPCATAVTIPPGYEYMTVGEMPKEFTHGVLMRAFTDYSVAVGLERSGSYFPVGTGVLVRRGGHFGILTAYHCLHACSPEVRLGSQNGDTLWLILNRGRSVKVKPQEAIEHPLAKPISEEFGPDLTFIEILAAERLGTFKAVGTFWSLDHEPASIMQKFGNPLTPIVSTGYPGVHHNTIRDGNVVRQQIRHMVYDNAIKVGDVSDREGWDYLDTTIWYPGDPDLPSSFSGLSGGPVWGMELRKHKRDGHISIESHALIGIQFYEVYRNGDEGRLRAHFIKSIYDLAWRHFA
jgi:hypothetical protein